MDTINLVLGGKIRHVLNPGATNFPERTFAWAVETNSEQIAIRAVKAETLIEDNGNQSVAWKPAYQVAAMEEVDLASGMFAHITDKANRAALANSSDLSEGAVTYIFDVQFENRTLVYEEKKSKQKPGDACKMPSPYPSWRGDMTWRCILVNILENKERLGPNNADSKLSFSNLSV
ncbi:hypothetical protein K503DRAFT_785688 [Rhizopogon vinicolor AM-OR11-026]|uniref:Uncharacterized protein n=1 Tax=Rhizopogon vinicolor AM-OR11-026 TaxID=1314800 RepID=A0A1B7MPK2_9AGAM|nr:hypothetical protein K503DRAFT_785688 [Rhizopogon vinicolor AM-OR11-026]